MYVGAYLGFVTGIMADKDHVQQFPHYSLESYMFYLTFLGTQRYIKQVKDTCEYHSCADFVLLAESP